MALMRWTPMGHLPSYQHEMNRMVNEFFGRQRRSGRHRG